MEWNDMMIERDYQVQVLTWCMHREPLASWLASNPQLTYVTFQLLVFSIHLGSEERTPTLLLTHRSTTHTNAAHMYVCSLCVFIAQLEKKGRGVISQKVGVVR